FDSAQQSAALRIVRRFAPLGSWKFQQVQHLLFPLCHTISLLPRVRPDVLHAGDLYPQGLIALICKKLFGLRYVVYCHGEEITQIEGRRTERVLRDRVYASADAVIAASEFAR